MTAKISTAGLAAWVRNAAMTALFALSFVVLVQSAAQAASLPSDDEQEILVRTTLMTFNDANMTGIYSVLHAKASKQIQTQVSVEKLFEVFQGFRTKQLFFEDIVYEDYDSWEAARIDSEGVLILAGVFKTDRVKVKYSLKFVQNDKVWKWLGIEADVTKL